MDAGRIGLATGAFALGLGVAGPLPADMSREAAIVATRQYAKRQRTYFARRMADWRRIDASSTDLSTALATGS